MGVATAWIAIRGKPKEQILQNLRLEIRQTMNASPPYRLRRLLGTKLAGDWYIIFGYRRWHTQFSFSVRKRFTRLGLGFYEQLSRDAQLVTCSVEEHVMVSDASEWRNGEKVWSVVCEEGGNLSINGIEVPDDIGRHLPVDLDLSEYARNFDVPVELARRLVDYRYDDWPPLAQNFDILHRPTWLGALLAGSIKWLKSSQSFFGAS